MKFIVSCVQTNCTNNLQKNIEQTISLIQKSAKSGAKLICLPENSSFMAANPEELMANSYPQNNNPVLKEYCKSAKENSIWLLVGSIGIKIYSVKKLANRSFLISPKGVITNQYDKIHLYKANVQGGECQDESKRYIAGNKAVIANCELAKIGMTICYDLRFPQLFRALAQNGAQIISAPAAFTQFTGEAHWHTLLKARAIETGCYIVAAAQTGLHPANRKTYGHSLIIDPWGDIIADAQEEIGYITAEIDLNKVITTRQSIASIYHDKKFEF